MAKMARENPLGDNEGHVGYQVGVQGVAGHGWILIKRVAYARADKQASIYSNKRFTENDKPPDIIQRTNRFIWVCFTW